MHLSENGGYMRLLGQDKDIVVNFDNVYTIMSDLDGTIKSYNGIDSTTIGVYDTKDRADEIIRNIYSCKYEYFSMPNK